MCVEHQEFEVVDPADLVPHPDLDRLFEGLSPDEQDLLARRMADGEPFPPLLVDPTGRILAGAEHWRAAKSLGWRTLSAVRAPEMTPSQARALMMSENVRYREVREEHLWRGMNNFFDMEPLRPPGGW